MAAREDMTVQERIDAALELAERICAACRPVRIESGPQSEAQFDEQMLGRYRGWEWGGAE